MEENTNEPNERLISLFHICFPGQLLQEIENDRPGSRSCSLFLSQLVSLTLEGLSAHRSFLFPIKEKELIKSLPT